MQDIQKYPTVTSLQIQLADPGLEKEKKSIYSHPLYPLLALLLEQCEQATSSPDSQTPDTFDADLQSYIQRHEGNDKMFLTENKELDTLIIKAIQVLRIHLNELRKVNELCRDFCTRYINCLKTKIHQDSMFDDSEESSPNGSERLSPNIMSGSAYNSPYNLQAGSVARNYLEMGANHRHQHMLGQLHNMGHNCSSTMNGISVDCVDYMNGNSSSPPLSGISLHDEINNNNYMNSSTNPGAYNNLLDPSKQKRGVLPKKATQIMKQWLFQHLVHPYPTEDEKRQIANQTNLTLLQVNNWFINARRRILQPMLDNSGSPTKDKTGSGNSKLDKSDSVSESEDTGSGLMYNSSCGNRKKKAATNRPSNNRFWPASLAAAVNILSPHPAMTTCTAPSPVTTAASGRSTPKIMSQIEILDPSRSRKRTKTVSSDIDVYQPPKVFSSVKESYDSYITDLEYSKSHHRKDTKSQSDRSTPQYTELSSPNNSKSNSLDDSDRTRSESFCLPLTNLPASRHSSPKLSQDSQKLLKPDIISSYLSTSNNFNPTSHDLSAVSLFPPNPYPYVPTNPYANIIMPQTNAYLTHPAMLYNVSLQRAAQHNEANSMSSALFGMRHPTPHTFPMYDSIYPNYEHLMDKRSNMASHINDLFATPHGFSKGFSQYANMDNSSSVSVKNEFIDTIPESGSLSNTTNTNNNHSHSHFDTFPNFKAFHSKTNTN